jgi:hypothetical protein
VSKLPDRAQDEIAQIILDELASDRRGDVSFAHSQGLHGNMAVQALSEHRAGKTRTLKT